jgi:kynureninase
MRTAAELDAADELAGFASRFAKLPGMIYLDGNSLGLLCREAEASLWEAVEAWRRLAIRGWTDGPEPWFGLSRKVAGQLALLIGAEPDDVMVGQSTTVNLHQILSTFGQPLHTVMIDGTHFPTDRYAVECQLRSTGEIRARTLVVVEPGAERLLDENSLVTGLNRVGFAVLPSVVFTTGQMLDVAALAAEARRREVLIAWDCSHSAGVIPHHFRRDEIDLAFGCTYKYLNGGPGSVGWLYVHPRLRDRLPGLAGWFGSDPARQFKMSAEFHPSADAGRYQIGTPHIFSLAPLVGSLGVVAEAGIDRIRAKSLDLTAFLREQAETRLGRLGVGCVTPREDDRRGGHLAITHPAAGEISRALRLRGVIPDFRPPDILRLAPAPLYTSFAECERAVDVLEGILAHNLHEQLPDADASVT